MAAISRQRAAAEQAKGNGFASTQNEMQARQWDLYGSLVPVGAAQPNLGVAPQIVQTPGTWYQMMLNSPGTQFDPNMLNWARTASGGMPQIPTVNVHSIYDPSLAYSEPDPVKPAMLHGSVFRPYGGTSGANVNYGNLAPSTGGSSPSATSDVYGRLLPPGTVFNPVLTPRMDPNVQKPPSGWVDDPNIKYMDASGNLTPPWTMYSPYTDPKSPYYLAPVGSPNTYRPGQQPVSNYGMSPMQAPPPAYSAPVSMGPVATPMYNPAPVYRAPAPAPVYSAPAPMATGTYGAVIGGRPAPAPSPAYIPPPSAGGPTQADITLAAQHGIPASAFASGKNVHQLLYEVALGKRYK